MEEKEDRLGGGEEGAEERKEGELKSVIVSLEATHVYMYVYSLTSR